MVELEVKAIRFGNSIRVAIPAEVLKASGVKEGDTLKIDWDKESKVVTLRKE